MDFIDWNNEYEYIYNGSAIENEEDNSVVDGNTIFSHSMSIGMHIPHGMERETFMNLIVLPIIKN
jgi:hypothetical protein